MSTQFQKRGRLGRLSAVKVMSESTSDWRDVLSNRSVQVRLLIAFLAIAVILIIVQGWRHAFPHRLGDRPADGVAAMIRFSHVNHAMTQRAAERAADRAPLIFRRDPQLHQQIINDLRSQLESLAAYGTLGDVPEQLKRDFGLADGTMKNGAPGPLNPDRVEAFERLRRAASNEASLNELRDEFTQFLQRIAKTGLILPEHLPTDRGASDIAEIRGPDDLVEEVSLSQISLQSVLSTGGLLDPTRWNVFTKLSPIQTELDLWLRIKNPETLQYDKTATQENRRIAREQTPTEFDTYSVGQTLVGAGELIDDVKLELLKAEYAELESLVPAEERVLRILVVFLMLSVMAILIGYHLVHNERKLLWNLPRFTRYVLIIVIGVWLCRAASFDPWRAEIGTVLAAVMVCVVVHNQVLATLTAFAMSVIVTTSCGGDLGQFTVMMSVCSAAVIFLPSVPSRSTLVTVGAIAAFVCLLMHWGMALIQSASGTLLWSDSTQWSLSLRSAGWCLAAGFLVSGSLPFIESWFGAVTDISLLELGDVSHPLLQELVRRAPGTYNHSITVASLGETAADAIGANGLMVRVGAYFHDVGKLLKPHYFIENALGGENRHDNLAPAMSTLIIIGHVKDGVDLARQHGLPEPLMDFIEQHHGTTLVEYFYHEATRLAEEQTDHRNDVQESLFRYPGPKPQSKESAVLMIADAVEGASRALSEPTASRIERLVHDIVMKRLLDGQFSECGLTLTDLNRIEESLSISLTAMYHGRVKYPEQRSA